MLFHGLHAPREPLPSSPRRSFREGNVWRRRLVSGVARMLVSSQTPRSTTDVRTGYDVSARILPWPNSPLRFSSVSVTRRKVLP